MIEFRELDDENLLRRVAEIFLKGLVSRVTRDSFPRLSEPS